jgi:hypothetical protein
VLGDRGIEGEVSLVHEAALELSHEDVDLALGNGARSPPRARKPVPGAREREEVGARAPAVRGEHRTHAAAVVDVRAGDHALARLHAFEHRLARGPRQAVDRATQLLDGCAAGV